MDDTFRPRHRPAQDIYDALMMEARKRKERSIEEWVTAERLAVLNTATRVAKELKLHVPSTEDVVKAETYAMGHTDYAAKLAYALTEAMYVGPESRVAASRK